MEKTGTSGKEDSKVGAGEFFNYNFNFFKRKIQRHKYHKTLICSLWVVTTELAVTLFYGLFIKLVNTKAFKH